MVGCFAAPFTPGPATFGDLLGLGEAGTFRGAGPIVGAARSKGVGEKGKSEAAIADGRANLSLEADLGRTYDR